MATRFLTYKWSIGAKLAYYTDRLPDGGCWLWRGTIDNKGYGQLRLGRKVIRKAHRLSWAEERGPIPPGMCVCHKCDVPACVNPDHLFLGTHSENMLDMFAKGRAGKRKWRRGSTSPTAKLTEQQVLAIRADTRTQEAIGLAFGVSESNVQCIRAGRSWAHLLPDTSRDV